MEFGQSEKKNQEQLETDSQQLQQSGQIYEGNSQIQQEEPFQEQELLDLAKKSPKKKITTLDLVEYQACKSRRLLEESTQLQSQYGSINNNNIHQKLYDESIIIKDKYNSMQDIQKKQIKEFSEDSKMIDKTYKVLITKLERNLTSIIEQIVGEEKEMSFEQLGRLLTMLEAFRVLYYDENCQFQNQEALDNEMSQFQNKRKFQEMVLHEKVWTLLAGSEDVNRISIQLVWCVFRILLDHAKINLNQRANVIKDYLSKFRENQASEDEILDFLKYFNELKLDNMAYKKIGFLKPNKFDEYMRLQSESMTFKPKINDINYLLESHNTAQFLEKHPIEGVNTEFYQSINKDYEYEFYSKTLSGEINRQNLSRSSVLNSRTNHDDRVKLLYKKQEVRDSRVKQQQNEKEQENFRECTFQPDVSINQRVNDWSVVSKYGNTGIFQRLYTLDHIIEKEMRINQKEQEDEKSHYETCTFTPQINRNRSLYTNDIVNKLDGKDLVRGYEKMVGRIRYGTQQKEILKSKLDHISVGENYETLKKKGVNPPSMLTRSKPKKRTPFYVIEIAMGNGKHGRISLYDNDDPYKVTNSFAKSFQITGENKTDLFLKVKTQIDLHNAKKKQGMKDVSQMSNGNNYRNYNDVQYQQQQQFEQQQQQFQHENEMQQYQQYQQQQQEQQQQQQEQQQYQNNIPAQNNGYENGQPMEA